MSDQDCVPTPSLAFHEPKEGEAYVPAPVDDDELDRIKEEMRLSKTQLTPENVGHALEAEEIRRMLRRHTIRSIRKVAATRDCAGVVKLSFAEWRWMMNEAYLAGRDGVTL